MIRLLKQDEKLRDEEYYLKLQINAFVWHQFAFEYHNSKFDKRVDHESRCIFIRYIDKHGICVDIRNKLRTQTELEI